MGAGESIPKMYKKLADNFEGSIVQKLWDQYDEDGNGVLEGEEIEKFFEDLYNYVHRNERKLSQVTPEERSEMLQRWMLFFDENNDGALQKEEFVGSLQKLAFSHFEHTEVDKSLKQAVERTRIQNIRSQLRAGIEQAMKCFPLETADKLEALKLESANNIENANKLQEAARICRTIDLLVTSPTKFLKTSSSEELPPLHNSYTQSPEDDREKNRCRSRSRSSSSEHDELLEIRKSRPRSSSTSSTRSLATTRSPSSSPSHPSPLRQASNSSTRRQRSKSTELSSSYTTNNKHDSNIPLLSSCSSRDRPSIDYLISPSTSPTTVKHCETSPPLVAQAPPKEIPLEVYHQEQAYQQCIEVFPNFLPAINNYTIAHIQHPRESDTHHYMCRMKSESSANQEILRHYYEIALESNPPDGDFLEYAFGVCLDQLEEKPRKALPFFERALHKGYSAASCWLGKYYLEGAHTIQDPRKDYFKTGVNLRNAEAKYLLALTFCQGPEAWTDPKVTGLPQLPPIGTRFSRRIEPKAIERALRLLQAAAEQGYFGAYHKMAQIYEDGRSTSPDYKKVITLYQKAADFGVRESYQRLAELYFQGRVVNRDDALAVSFLKKGAELGHSSCMVEYGQCLYLGRGVERDHQRASRLFKKAADLNHGDGYFYLAIMFSEGQLGPDHGKAQQMAALKKAAELGSVKAQKRLGTQALMSALAKQGLSFDSPTDCTNQ